MKPFLIALILSASPAHGFSHRAPVQWNPEPAASPSLNPIPAPLILGQVTFAPVAYYSTPAQRARVASAGAKLNQVVQGTCFHDFMLAEQLRETNGETVPQVVAHLQSLSGIVPVKFYYARFSSAIAFRQPPEIGINLNTKFLGAESSDCEMGSTLAHESLGHSLGGYGHSFKWTRQREDTVPYVMGGRKAQYGGDAFMRCCR